MVDGGCRQRVVVVLLGGAILYLALLAGVLSGDVLVHRVQNLLTYGLGGVLLLSLILTAILGCGSLASEFEEKQIYTVTTKPIGRGSFLLGKWIGVLAINLVLLTVAGLEVHVLTTLQVWDVDDPSEVERVQREVLTARMAIPPNDETDPALRARFDDYLPEYAKKNSRAIPGARRRGLPRLRVDPVPRGAPAYRAGEDAHLPVRRRSARSGDARPAGADGDSVTRRSGPRRDCDRRR